MQWVLKNMCEQGKRWARRLGEQQPPARGTMKRQWPWSHSREGGWREDQAGLASRFSECPSGLGVPWSQGLLPSVFLGPVTKPAASDTPRFG